MQCCNPTRTPTIGSKADLDDLANRPGVLIHSSTSHRDFDALGEVVVEYCQDLKDLPSGHVN
jgi:hypothetical protein